MRDCKGCSLSTVMLYIAVHWVRSLHCAVCAPLVQDTRSGRSKGYGFVTMADKASVSDILTRRMHNIEGKRVCAEYTW